MATTLVYVGTYSLPEGHVRESKGQGIYTYELDLATGKLTYRALTGGIDNPSYLALDSKHRYLYAVAEVSNWPEGKCYAYRVDPATGALTYINQQSTLGGAACYVTVDQTDHVVLVANYLGPIGVVTFPIEDDGALAPVASSVRHHGSGPMLARQQAPHAHSTVLDPANRFLFVPDLGIDKVMSYQFDAATGTITANAPDGVSLAPGGGPRHFVFHPSGKFAYAIQELTSTITMLTYDAAGGSLQVLGTISTLPPDFTGESTCAALQIAPSGKYLYGSNRGHNSIAAFAIDELTGKLTPVGYQPTHGDTPRDFAIDPTGTYLLAANQDTHTVVTFRIDPATGGLIETGQVAEIPTPVCLKMIQI